MSRIFTRKNSNYYHFYFKKLISFNSTLKYLNYFNSKNIVHTELLKDKEFQIISFSNNTS